MKNALVKLQNATAQQGDNLLALCQVSLNTAQETIDLNTRAARQLLALCARHAPAVIEQPTVLPMKDMASALAQVWNDYLQASQALARDLQEQAGQWLESQSGQLSETFASSLAELKAPNSANQEAMDAALQSWVAMTQNSFAQAAKWQQTMEQAQQSGAQALSALTGKAPATTTAKRRASTVAA